MAFIGLHKLRIVSLSAFNNIITFNHGFCARTATVLSPFVGQARRSFTIQPQVRAGGCIPQDANLALPTRKLGRNARFSMNYPGHTQCNVCINVPVYYTSSRHYAKGKGKGKDKGGKKGGGKFMELSREELNAILDSDKFHAQLDGQLEHLTNEFTQQLNIRTSIGAFDSVTIETSDGNFPLIQLGQVSQKGGQTVVINMGASPQYIPAVKNALINSMSLNAQQDGTTLFVSIPKVTKEHRESLAKTAKGVCDKTKVKLRDIQNKNLQLLKKEKSQHSEDLVFSAQHYVQEEVKNYIEKVDSLTAAKQKELLGGK